MSERLKKFSDSKEERMSLDEAIEEIREHGWLIDFRPRRGMRALRVIDKALRDYKNLQKDYVQLRQDYEKLKENK